MGNSDTKLQYRKAVIQLTTKNQPIDAKDEDFWEQFWSENVTSVQDVFTLVPATEIRALREEAPSNLATLCYKAVEKMVRAVDSSCRTQQEQTAVLNCARLLTRLLPYIFEEPDWVEFFWTSLPEEKTEPSEREGQATVEGGGAVPLAHSLLSAISDLLFCPDFTVASKKSGPDKAEDLQSLDSCEYIWERGVGFAGSPPRLAAQEAARMELLKLLLTCFSETIYQPPIDIKSAPNKWIQYLTSEENRHALPMFTSLLNTVCAYDPVGLGLPYNHLIFEDTTEPLVETALQILIVTLDHDTSLSQFPEEFVMEEVAILLQSIGKVFGDYSSMGNSTDNLFINYLSRIHRDEDFGFVLHGFTRLLNNPLVQTYLPNSTKKVQFHQELLVFFWKMCDYNKKFLYYVLKSSDVLEILVPILYHLNDSRADQSRVGLMHIGVFIILLLSGERNFGVRLNKPYSSAIPMDIPVFTGTHGDLLIIVFHKIITTGHQRLQPLFDCLLTILVNVSPYLKTLSMVASTKLLHLLEAFSTPWFLFSSPSNHHLVFFLLEIFNNIIQYQFDGNSNLVYTIIRKRGVFHSLANLPSDHSTISKSLSKQQQQQLAQGAAAAGRGVSRGGGSGTVLAAVVGAGGPGVLPPESPSPSMEGSRPALPALPGTLNATLLDTPGIENMTGKESAHMSSGGETAVEELVKMSESITLNGSTTTAGSGIASNLSTLPGGNSGVTARSNSEPEGNSPPRETPTSTISSPPHSMAKKGVGERRSGGEWSPTSEWVNSWRSKLPLQTIMRLLQVLVPQVEKICIDKGLTDESEILKFLQHGTLVGLLPVPHPILIRKYQANAGTTAWFRTYMWGVIYLRNVDPPIWYDTDVKLFEIQRV